MAVAVVVSASYRIVFSYREVTDKDAVKEGDVIQEGRKNEPFHKDTGNIDDRKQQCYTDNQRVRFVTAARNIVVNKICGLNSLFRVFQTD